METKGGESGGNEEHKRRDGGGNGERGSGDLRVDGLAIHPAVLPL